MGKESKSETRYFTVVFEVPNDWHPGPEIMENKYFTAGSWSHAMHERDDARAELANATLGQAKLDQIVDDIFDDSGYMFSNERMRAILCANNEA